MRFSGPLCKQHIGRAFKKLWTEQSKREIIDSRAEKVLASRGIQVFQPDDILNIKPKIVEIDTSVSGVRPPRVKFDETHPNWHKTPLLTYKDNNVLLEGLSQAKILTNTVELSQGIPESLLNLKTTKSIDGRVKEIILTSHVFDAEQVKLPKIKDPERPAWNFPRSYGISQLRAIKLLLENLLQAVENASDLGVVKQRYFTEDTHFSYNFERGDDLIQFEMKGDSLLSSEKPLNPISYEKTQVLALPDIHPINPIITLNVEHIYEIRGFYPLNLDFSKSYPHTIFIPHEETQVKNLYEEPVTDQQVFGRSLLKTFTVCASYARQKYGAEVKELPKPITVQCVHTNGRLFHFGIFQLNTLNTSSDKMRNIWFQTERIPLFDSCSYVVGKPVLEGYNNEVTKYLHAFYNNI